MELVTTVLAFAHIFSAISWLGGGLMFGFVIAPRLGKIPLAAARAFTVEVVPRVLVFFEIVAGLTILFGVGLLYSITGGDWSQLSPSTTWGFAITVGVGVAIVAFLFSVLVAVPVFKRVVALNRKMNPDGTNVPPELPRTVRQAGMASLVTLVLLLVTLAFMVTAGFY